MAKIKDIKSQNPTYLIDVVGVLGENDPTKTNKYLPFMVNQTKDWIEWIHTELKNETFKEMFEIIKDFEDLSTRNLLENKDIYSYESNQDIIEAVKLAKDRVTHSEVKKKETEVLFEDERWVVIYPLTTRSSNMYGKATKWCVASEDQNYGKYFKQYTDNGVLVFVIDKSVKDKEAQSNMLSKVAFHNDRNKGDGITAWDVTDSQLSVSNTMKFSSMVGPEVIQIIYDRLESGQTNQEAAKEKGLKQG